MNFSDFMKIEYVIKWVLENTCSAMVSIEN